MEDLAAGTSLEYYLKLAEAAPAPVPAEDDDGGKAAEFEDDTGTGEKYTPFGSVYGSASAEISAVLEAAQKAVAEEGPAEATPDMLAATGGSEADVGAPTPTSEAYLAAQKSNTTRWVGG